VISHAPAGYDCPYCGFLDGRITEYNSKDDIVCQSERASAFICPVSWQKNLGNVLVVPNKHYENIYSIPDDDLAAIFKLVKKVAAAMRAAYGCGGVTVFQRNEPDAGQHVWHLHVHVVPRYPGDDFQEAAQTLFVDAATRAPFAQKVRDYSEASA
jgi:histidine triad (HIT) family protein